MGSCCNLSVGRVLGDIWKYGRPPALLTRFPAPPFVCIIAGSADARASHATGRSSPQGGAVSAHVPASPSVASTSLHARSGSPTSRSFGEEHGHAHAGSDAPSQGGRQGPRPDMFVRRWQLIKSAAQPPEPPSPRGLGRRKPASPPTEAQLRAAYLASDDAVVMAPRPASVVIADAPRRSITLLVQARYGGGTPTEEGGERWTAALSKRFSPSPSSSPYWSLLMEAYEDRVPLRHCGTLALLFKRWLTLATTTATRRAKVPYAVDCLCVCGCPGRVFAWLVFVFCRCVCVCGDEAWHSVACGLDM